MRLRLFAAATVCSLVILPLSASTAHAKFRQKPKMAKNLGYMDTDASVANEDVDEGVIRAPAKEKDKKATEKKKQPASEFKETPDEKAAVRAAQHDLTNTEKLFEREDCVNPEAKLPQVETARYEEIESTSMSQDRERQAAKVKADSEEMKRIDKIINTEKLLKQVTSAPAPIEKKKTKAEILAEKREAAREAAAIKKALAHARAVKIEFSDSDTQSAGKRDPASVSAQEKSPKSDKTASAKTSDKSETIAGDDSPSQALVRHNDRVNQSLEEDIQ